MSTRLLLFLGIQGCSLLIAGILIWEHWRICKLREEMFHRLGDGKNAGRKRSRIVIVTLYVVTSLCITAVSGYVFFLMH